MASSGVAPEVSRKSPQRFVDIVRARREAHRRKRRECRRVCGRGEFGRGLERQRVGLGKPVQNVGAPPHHRHDQEGRAGEKPKDREGGEQQEPGWPAAGLEAAALSGAAADCTAGCSTAAGAGRSLLMVCTGTAGALGALGISARGVVLADGSGGSAGCAVSSVLLTVRVTRFLMIGAGASSACGRPAGALAAGAIAAGVEAGSSAVIEVRLR